MFLPLDTLFEYWIEQITFGLVCVMFRFSTRIFNRGVTICKLDCAKNHNAYYGDRAVLISPIQNCISWISSYFVSVKVANNSSMIISHCKISSNSLIQHKVKQGLDRSISNMICCPKFCHFCLQTKSPHSIHIGNKFMKMHLKMTSTQWYTFRLLLILN